MLAAGTGLFSRMQSRRDNPVTDSTAIDWIKAMTTQPNNDRKRLYQTFVLTLKHAGIWDKIAGVWICATHDEQAARINGKQPTQIATPVAAPVFTTDLGFAGNGTSSYLNTTATGSGSPPYLRDSHHMGVWVGADVTSIAQADCGFGNGWINSRYDATSARLRAGTGQTNITFTSLGDPATSAGHTQFSRLASTGYNTQKNGGAAFSTTLASANLVTDPVLFCAQGSSGGPLQFSTRPVWAFHYGGGLTPAEGTIFYNALRDFLIGVGAIIVTGILTLEDQPLTLEDRPLVIRNT